MKRIVITGSTGAIGIALIRRCIEEKIEVYALCRKKSKRMKNIPKSEHVHVIEINLDEISKLDIKDISECDAFYHLGWEATNGDARNDMRVQIRNVQYTLDAVDLAHRLGCKVFVGAGSQAEYGRVEGKLNDMVATAPENGYGIAKLCAGQMSRIECNKRDIKHIWVRILSIYGPYDSDKTMISNTIQMLLDKKSHL